MKKLIIAIVFIVALVAVLKEITGPNSKLIKKTYSLPKTAQLQLRIEPLQCELERVVVKSTAPEAKAVEGSNYLKAWESVVYHKEDEVPLYLITPSEIPWVVGQEFLFATNCIEMEEEAIVRVKTQVEEAKNPCMGMFLWDKDSYQVSRECGYIVDEKAVILEFKK